MCIFQLIFFKFMFLHANLLNRIPSDVYLSIFLFTLINKSQIYIGLHIYAYTRYCF